MVTLGTALCCALVLWKQRQLPLWVGSFVLLAISVGIDYSSVFSQRELISLQDKWQEVSQAQQGEAPDLEQLDALLQTYLLTASSYMEKQPQAHRVRYTMAESYRRLGNHSQALEQLTVVHANLPLDPEVTMSYATALLGTDDKNNWQQAHRLLVDLERVEGVSLHSAMLQAQYFERQSDFQAAYDKLITAKPLVQNTDEQQTLENWLFNLELNLLKDYRAIKVLLDASDLVLYDRGDDSGVLVTVQVLILGGPKIPIARLETFWDPSNPSQTIELSDKQQVVQGFNLSLALSRQATLIFKTSYEFDGKVFQQEKMIQFDLDDLENINHQAVDLEFHWDVSQLVLSTELN